MNTRLQQCIAIAGCFYKLITIFDIGHAIVNDVAD